MNSRIPAPPPANSAPPRAEKSGQDQGREKKEELDQELDQELNDTFPASDPLPWSHEVK